MSYQVLARKWRPRTFHELVGQDHVARALVNALDQERLHHAYLFTGTRGVGKTTIARIFAKCLNCEQGVSSTPCGECATCKAIDENRFVDLIEVDAASRTKVEDTRELLDNVQYAPTQGRFKVYLIDEVHMLSSHSFNALLKTLEEPPPHVKFLLATTDPQRLPVTVLSRCLQFALKAMPPEQVVGHLTHILGVEGVSFDEQALWLLGRAADGSMRDALSLTDQAISFGQGNISETDVRAMLGTLDHRYIVGLAEAIAQLDAATVLKEIARLAEQAPDFAAVLDELSGLFHRLAVAQMVPNALDNGFGDRDSVVALAQQFTAEDVQLYYQIALGGRNEMANAPEPRAALEMTLLRMLAFRPQGIPRPPEVALPLRGGSERQTPTGHASGGVSQDSDDPAPAGSSAASAPASSAPSQTPADASPAQTAKPTPPAAAQFSAASGHQPPSDGAAAAEPAPNHAGSSAAPHRSTVAPPPWDQSASESSVPSDSAAASQARPDTEAAAPANTDEPSRHPSGEPEAPTEQPSQAHQPTEQALADARPNEQPSQAHQPAEQALADARPTEPPSQESQSSELSPASNAVAGAGANGQGLSYGSDDSDADDEDDSYAEYAALEPSNDVSEAFSQALDDDAIDRNALAADSASPSEAETASSYRFADGVVIDQAVWLDAFPHIRLGGITGNLIANCAVERDEHQHLELRLAPSQAAMNAEIHARRLESELARLGAQRKVTIVAGDIAADIETPHSKRQRLLQERRARAVEALHNDPHIQMLRDQFGAQLLNESVTSLEADSSAG
ncbi:DNA polymerase III subunit gamma/tau [Carnimonas bestiolae]|uniref:DNA polymerase III subunit gamma/tau n=1 Tax=Carnimonas bestiolae TaxID=3402172 RepID=UPI003EDC71F2